MREGRENRDWDVRKREKKKKKKKTENIAICLREITGERQEIMPHKDNIQQGSSLPILYPLILKTILRDRKAFASTPGHEDGSIQGSRNSP